MKKFLIGFCVWLLIFVVAFCFVMLTLDAANSSYRRGYEIGYIDACKDFYQGKIKYELVEHADGTKTWERVENE